MPRESFAFRVRGSDIEPRDPAFRSASDDAKEAFYKAAVAWVEQAMDKQLAAGLDRFGEPLTAIAESTRRKGRWRSHTGKGTPDNPPLTPANALSRTRKLFDARAHFRERYILGFWRFDSVTGRHWGQILGWHREGAGNLPERDVIGLSPASTAWVREQGEAWWRAYGHAERAKLFRVALPIPSGRPIPAPRPKPMVPAAAARIMGRTDIENSVGSIAGMGDAAFRAAVAKGTTTGFRKRGGWTPPGGGVPAAKPRPPATTKRAAMRPKATRPKPAPKPIVKTPPPPPRPGEHKTLAEARAWAEARGVRLTPNMPGGEVPLDLLNDFNRQFAKIPDAVHGQLGRAGGGLDLFMGQGIPDHPDLAHMRGLTPRGWVSGRTWDDVPGGGGTETRLRTYIVANSLTQRHGSANLVLHEHAHTYDVSFYHAGGNRASIHPDWMALHNSIDWGLEYLTNYPEESFAESFARYYNGPETRAKLAPEVRAYFEQKFGPIA